MEYNNLTVKELKKLLHAHGLPISGIKSVLIDRLKVYDAKGSNNNEYKKFTVIQLKSMLKERKLPTIGNKAELISRLENYDKNLI